MVASGESQDTSGPKVLITSNFPAQLWSKAPNKLGDPMNAREPPRGQSPDRHPPQPIGTLGHADVAQREPKPRPAGSSAIFHRVGQRSRSGTANGIASSLEISSSQASQMISTARGKTLWMVWETAFTTLRRLEIAAHRSSRTGPRCAAAIAVIRLLASASTLRASSFCVCPHRHMKQRLQHLHVVLDAMVQLAQQHAAAAFPPACVR